jgi:hypothetical protein
MTVPPSLTDIPSWAINLDRRPDRWLTLCEHLRTNNLPEPSRWAAVDGAATSTDAELARYRRGNDSGLKARRADLGITKSWVGLLNAVPPTTGWVLFFEDDVRLLPGWQDGYRQFAAECPDDAEVILLGAIHKNQPQQVSEHVWRARKVTCAHAWLATGPTLPLFAAAAAPLTTSFDWAWNEVHDRGRTYLTRPHLAIQNPATRSDVSGRIPAPRPQQYGRI